MFVPGGVPSRPRRSYARRLRIHDETSPTCQDSQQSTQSLLTNRRSSVEESEYAQHGSPLVTLGEPPRAVPDSVRSLLRRGLEINLGCLHAFERPHSYGNVEWYPDALNASNARLAYNNLHRDHVDDRIKTHILFEAPITWLTNLRVLCGDRWYVDANRLLLARELGIVAKLPKLSAERVSDLNKEDIFVKLLAISQIVWLCLQLSMRLGQGISTTQLEIMTMGYAVCSAMTYFFLFNRPKDVTTVFDVEAARYPTSDEFSFIASIGPDIFGPFRSTVSLPNNSVHQNGYGDMVLGSTFAVVCFGSLHLAAWNYEFPTPTERTLWRASTLMTITVIPAMCILPLLALLFNALFNSNPPGRLVSRANVQRFCVSVTFWVMAPLFIAARLFILVEVIRSLAYQPPGSYKTTWASYVPYVG
jgi:hypothetical protein